MGTVEKNTLIPPINKKQSSSVEHKLDQHFRDSDYFEHQKASPDPVGYNREFGSLEEEIKHYLEPGPLGNKTQNNNRTDYQFDVHIKGS
jgi:hypothetical protein